MKKRLGKAVTVICICLTAVLAGLFPAPVSAAAKSTSMNVLCDSNNYPFEWYDQSSETYKGIDVDILEKISGKSGIEFNYVHKDTLKSAWEAIGKGEADIIAGVYIDDALAEKYNITASKQYTTEDSIAVVRAGSKIKPSGALTVAVNESFIGLQKYLRKTHPDWTQVTAPTFDDCLKLVSRRQADLTFISIVQLQKSSTVFKYDNLTLLSELQVSLPIHLGISNKADKAAVSKINKAIAGLTDEEIEQAVINNTAADQTDFSLRNFIYYHTAEIVLLVFIFAVLIAAVVLMVYRSRRKAGNEAILREKNRQLEMANKSKDEFLSRISHDMRTPLNGIMGMTRIARQGDHDPKTADCLDKIDVSSSFLLGLINDVLDMSKAESGKIELHEEPYLMADFDRYLEAVIRPLCDEKNQQLTLKTVPVADAIPIVDILRFNQIMFNLLSNAVKYTPEGGNIELEVMNELVPGHRERITASVRDDGIGMSEEFQKVLFDPFSQEGRNDVSESRGTGLGLAIVKKLVDLMGGTISVESRQGGGSVFTVDILFDYVEADQVVWENNKRSRHDSAPDEDILAGLHVLVCEDHMLNQEIVRTLLMEKEMLFDIAEDGRQGTEMFRRSPTGYYDVILMDIRMPVMNGYEAAEAIRKMDRPDAGTVAIIAMTADAFADDVKKCLDAGMNAHIPKPIDPEVMFRTIAEAAAGR
ncbi:MAG: ATP-binding protein [Eubacteriaceae bacterium]|jgi:signal transduction histidine kinase|nr:ATP-binding protein [Eubacteriaceae bacterium]